ncbi:hypothetical protein EJ08DRAFT_713556 [Tothia fuscella]|uniref:Secreted protein n=1 Tax=Tothia fuscella TaxID=1048955 RepID=A0A9P4NTA0_9PEZI|nr:hypothetical protein EJ08DRAFT_713556 [Tothia fuscella]
MAHNFKTALLSSVLVALVVSAKVQVNASEDSGSSRGVNPQQSPQLYIQAPSSTDAAGTWDLCAASGCSKVDKLCGDWGCVSTQDIHPPWVLVDTDKLGSDAESDGDDEANQRPQDGAQVPLKPAKPPHGGDKPSEVHCPPWGCIGKPGDGGKKPDGVVCPPWGCIGGRASVSSIKTDEAAKNFDSSQESEGGLKLCGSWGCIPSDTLINHLGSLFKGAPKVSNMKSEL